MGADAGGLRHRGPRRQLRARRAAVRGAQANGAPRTPHPGRRPPRAGRHRSGSRRAISRHRMVRAAEGPLGLAAQDAPPVSGMRIIVAGGVGAMPFAGVTWQVLHYLEGFRRLGHEVLYLEDTQRWPYDPVNETVCDDAGPAITYIEALMSAHQFEWAYRDVASEELYGASEKALTDALLTADLLVNVSGVMILREEHMRVPM